MVRVSQEAIEKDKVASRARYQRNRPARLKSMKAYGNSQRHRDLDAIEQRERLMERRFIGWDSEGYDAFAVSPSGVCEVLPQRTMLFGCSDGDYITGVDLGTIEMLELLLTVEAREPDAFHIGFSFEYDVNQILKDLPWRMLAVLKLTGKVRWNGYRIAHTPHKSFTVSRNGIVCTVYDCFGFFHCKYTTALEKYGIGSADKWDIIRAGKEKRGNFTYADLAEVIAYWRAEISLFPDLMDSVRESAYAGGFYISVWHGPGALATYALRHNGMSAYHSKNLKGYIQEAVRYAYAGGRFQLWQCGYHDGPAYTLDKNSAYVQAIAMLPRLDNGKWRRSDPAAVRGPSDIARFGLYHIVFDDNRPDMSRRNRAAGIPERPYPLFHRDQSGRLTWPSRVDGWFWSPEAKLVAGSPYAQFIEAIVYDDDGSYPFKWVEDAYQTRLRLGSASPAGKAYKWALAAIYGSFARRVGWDRKTRSAPSSHELAWAGFITSHCRAAIFDVADYAARRGGLISVDTDGVTSGVPFEESCVPEGFGDQLGQWKQDEFSGFLGWQNGIYWLRDKDSEEWSEAKSRGVPKGKIPIQAAFDALEHASFNPPYKPAKIYLQRTKYTGYRQAINGQYDKWRKWETEPNEIVFGGTGKGIHVPPFCAACRGVGGRLHTITHLPPKNMVSTEHKLPWLIPEPEDIGVGEIDITADNDLDDRL
jgi:hypothetical protein